MNLTNSKRSLVQMDAAIAGPLFMLAAAILFTMLNLIVKTLNPVFTVWHIGFYRFFWRPHYAFDHIWSTPKSIQGE